MTSSQNFNIELECLQCSRIIHRSKYERNSPETTNWWHKLFHMLESDTAIPYDRRLEVVKDIFPEKLFNRIFSILSAVKTCKRHADADKCEKNEIAIATKLPNIESSKSTTSIKKSRREIGPNNPYMKFFQRNPDRAAIWHTLPPLSLTEMNLNQKAETITTEIAQDFVQWMQSISDEDSPTTLTMPLVLKMFEIGFDTHAAHSLQIRVREMASVPDGVAILKGIPDMAKRSQLRRQLLRDLKASQQEKRVFAFSTKLDKEHQILPPKIADIDKWLTCRKVPQHLETMATVWQGITHLRSTRAYCEYLLDHPEITPPKYLVDMRMLDREALKGQPQFIPKHMDEDTGHVMPSNALLVDNQPLSHEMLLAP